MRTRDRCEDIQPFGFVSCSPRPIVILVVEQKADASLNGFLDVGAALKRSVAERVCLGAEGKDACDQQPPNEAGR
jgi:hypothetical protein